MSKAIIGWCISWTISSFLILTRIAYNRIYLFVYAVIKSWFWVLACKNLFSKGLEFFSKRIHHFLMNYWLKVFAFLDVLLLVILLVIYGVFNSQCWVISRIIKMLLLNDLYFLVFKVLKADVLFFDLVRWFLVRRLLIICMKGVNWCFFCL